jgi:hypothetical protein
MRIEILKERAEILCPFCRGALYKATDLAQCSICKTVHHLVCWQQNGRCSIHGCNGVETLIDQQIIASYRKRKRLAAFFDPNYPLRLSCVVLFAGIFFGGSLLMILSLLSVRANWFPYLFLIIFVGIPFLMIVSVPLSILLHILLSRCPVCFHFLRGLSQKEIAFCPGCNARFVSGRPAVVPSPKEPLATKKMQ